jgi:hypothetical protein
MRKLAKISTVCAVAVMLSLTACAALDGSLYTSPSTRPALAVATPVAPSTASNATVDAAQMASLVSQAAQAYFQQAAANAPTTQAAANDAEYASIAGTVSSLGNVVTNLVQSQQNAATQTTAALQSTTAQLTTLGKSVEALTVVAQTVAAAQPGTPWGTIALALAGIGAMILNHKNSTAATATVAASSATSSVAHSNTLQSIFNVITPILTVLGSIVPSTSAKAVAPIPVVVAPAVVVP